MINLNFRWKGDVYSTYFPFLFYMVLIVFVILILIQNFIFFYISILDFNKKERIVKDREKSSVDYVLTIKKGS